MLRVPEPGERSLVRAQTGVSSRARHTRLAFLLLLSVQAVCILRQRTPFFEDDAAFFFRYAESLAGGHGWRWNAEEAPVWGASAPLWLMVVASGVRLGLAAEVSTLLASWLFALAATALLGWVVLRLFGVRGVLALTPLLAINHLYSTWATSGMESPMTFFFIALALLAASGVGGGVLLGVAAGACIVHKLDLAPLGLALLAAAAVWRRAQLRTAVPLALGIAAAWYGFATGYFGSPLPNSFLRKFQASYSSVPRMWFIDNELLFGAGAWRLPLVAAGIWVLRRERMLLTVALVGVLAPSIAYTLKPPAEAFMWYAAATAPLVAFLAACGFARVLAGTDLLRRERLREPVALLSAALLAWPLVVTETPRVQAWHSYLSNIEPPMIAAGRWVNENLPPEARVLTSWGHPAYASRRFVYDWSFLNRHPEEGDLLTKYAPEVWIQAFFGPVEAFQVPWEFRVAQRLESPDKAYDYHVLVLVRKTVHWRSKLAEGRRALERERAAGDAAVSR